MIEMFKIKNELTPPIMNSLLERRNESYNFCKFQEFLTERKRTVYYGLETLSYDLHNYGLFYQKTSRKLNHSKFLKGK